jgi:hypothetical protein
MTSHAAAAQGFGRLPVDAHVHFHDRSRVVDTLEAATANFSALGLAAGDRVRGALLLAQSFRERVFEWLRDQPRVERWQIAAVPAEPQSLWLRSDATEILVVCGRQVVAEPGLEVLALGTHRRIEDGLGLAATLELARSGEALAVMPWGFGKWTGRRKRRVREAIDAEKGADLWMGDNGGRLSALPKPRLLGEGERRGHAILPGTDPFPFWHDYRRVGSFGCVVPVQPDADRPWQSIRAALRQAGASPQSYGRGSGLLAFGLKQARMQFHKHFRGGQA